MLELFISSYVLLVDSRLVNCDSLMESGQSSTSSNCSRFPEACLKRRNSRALYFGVLSPVSLRTFTTHSSSVDLCIMMAQTTVCQNSFLRCGQGNSVLCIFLRSSMKFDDSLSSITSASLALLSRQILPLPR